jgi:hypothetical protein
MEEEQIKKIVEVRALLEKRINDLEAELEGQRTILDFTNKILLENSFKKIQEIKKPILKNSVKPISESAKDSSNFIPLKSTDGEHLADLVVENNSMKIVLAEDKKYDVKTPPFTSFLVERVLKKMEESDKEAFRKGDIMPEKKLSFDIKKEGDRIREIIINNVTIQRKRELKSTIRWTLEKMYEKMTKD